MSTVSSHWNMACPKCGKDSSLYISALISVRLTPDGMIRQYDTEWNSSSICCCFHCGHLGVVRDFKLDASQTADDK